MPRVVLRSRARPLPISLMCVWRCAHYTVRARALAIRVSKQQTPAQFVGDVFVQRTRASDNVARDTTRRAALLYCSNLIRVKADLGSTDRVA